MVFIILLLLTPCYNCGAQESFNVKQLKKELRNDPELGNEIQLFIDIGNEIKGLHPDSGNYYFNEARRLIKELKSNRDKELSETKILLGEVSIEVAKGNYVKAFQIDSAALKLAKKLRDNNLIAHAYMSLGSIYYNLSQFPKAQELNYKALEIVNNEENIKLKGKILTNIGVIEFLTGNTRTADSIFQIPLEMAKKYNDNELIAASFLNIGLLNTYKGEYIKARDYFAKAIDAYTKINGKDGLVLCYQNIGNIVFAQGDYEQSLYYFNLNYNLSTELEDKTGLAKSAQNLGECYLHIGDHEKALDFYLQALEIKKILNDPGEIAITISSIGHIYHQMGDYERALSNYRLAHQTYKHIGLKKGIGVSASNMGDIFFETSNPDSAFFYYSLSERIFEKTEYRSNLADIYLRLSKYYFSVNNLLLAETYCKRADIIETETDNTIGRINCGLQLSGIYLKKSQNHINDDSNNDLSRAAINYALTSYNLAKENNYLPQQRDACEQLMTGYTMIKSYHDALKYAKIKMELSDSLSKKQRVEALLNTEIKWSSKQKQEEIERLEKEKKLSQLILNQQQSENKWQKLLIIFMGIFLVFSIMLIVLVIRINRKKRDLLFQKQMTDIVQLKMQNIQNRITPHFFFNALNAASFPLKDFPEHQNAFNNLLSILKLSLLNAESITVSLASELKIVEAYVNLYKFHLTGGMIFEKVLDNSNSEIQIPSMILQIPIENAIKHGLAPKQEDRVLKLLSTQTCEGVEFCIVDNGVGRRNSSDLTTGTGTGLKVLIQTITMLNLRNNKKIEFSIEDLHPDNLMNSGTMVKIFIPDNYNYNLN